MRLKTIRHLVAVLVAVLPVVSLAQVYKPVITDTTGTTVATGASRYGEQITLAWTSTASGAATASIDSLNGELLRVTFTPGAGGDAPSNLYDVVLKDEDGIDILGGTGANLSSSTASSKPCVLSANATGATDSYVFVPFPVYGTCTLYVTNAGAANKGTIRLYFRRQPR